MDNGDLNNNDIMSEAQNLMGFMQNSGSANQMSDILGGIMGNAMKQGGSESGGGMPDMGNISSMMSMFSGLMGGSGDSDMNIDQKSIDELQKLLGDKTNWSFLSF